MIGTWNSCISRIAFVMAVAGTLGLVMSGPVSAATGARIHGKTYGQWSAAWWEWQEANFPDLAFGEGLVDCSVGQRGPVWFLGGSTNNEPVERECLDPLKKNRHLFLPLVNGNFVNDPDEDLSIQDKREILDGLFSEVPPGAFDSVACDLQIDVDGTPAVFSTPIVRTQSPPFDYDGDPETISDGFWVMLDPLPSGRHEIRFTGGLCDVDTGDPIFPEDKVFPVDVTYIVTVE